MVEKDDVINVIKGIKDPELNLDIWTLGLIYDIKIENEVVKITMTLTSPMCPYGPQIIQEVKDKTKDIKGVGVSEVTVTYEPPWKPSEDLRALLGV